MGSFDARLGGIVVVSPKREELERVWESVSTWPERDRITLAKRILETVEGKPDETGRRLTANGFLRMS